MTVHTTHHTTTNPNQNTTWIARDVAHVWHPCTQMKDLQQWPIVPIRSAQGVWLTDFEGKRYLDAISSWWVNLFGHCHPHLTQAVQQQVATLDHVLLAGFSHAPVIELSEQLVQLAPAGLQHCFYADNGSSAVEVALKMSFHYWQNQGQPKRTRFVCLANSYHGETLGALSVSDVALYRQTYHPLLLDTLIAPTPDAYHRAAGQSPAEYAEQQIQGMRDLLERHAGQVCAVVIEPLVQCAGGMRMYDAIYLTRLRQLCDELQVHLIADEIAVGFGRTNRLFACEHASIRPDFLCLSKGLTGGVLPLSVTLTTASIYQAFYEDHHKLKAFLHSHSYTGNPLACAAALATLQLFQTTPVLVDNQQRSAQMLQAAQALRDHAHVSDVRQTGMILAIELVADKTSRTPYPWQQRRGWRVYQHALAQGVVLRPLGDVVYWMPPYVITAEEIYWLGQVTAAAIDAATRD